MRQVGKLSAAKVAKIKKPGRFGDGGGLWLQVTPTGVRSWLFRYMVNYRQREMGLGPLYTVSLAEAREKARQLRQQLLQAIDPLEAKQKVKQAAVAERARTVTFQQVADMYLNLHLDSFRNAKHKQQWQNTLSTYVFPKIGGISVADVDPPSILKIIQPLWSEKTETASRIRGRIERILDFACTSGFRSGDNPAAHILESLPKRSKVQRVEHHAALPFCDLPGLMQELRERAGMSARALEFLVLTAARTGEVTGATSDEIDLRQAVWTVPADRMKAGKEHRVPLCDRAVEILKGLHRERGNDHVFIGGKAGQGLSNMAMAELLKDMRPGFTVHGFRSTFRDWCSERTNYPNHVVEMALAHAVGNAVEAAYRRGDLFAKRKRLMAEWAKFCASRPAEGDNVIRLRRAK